MLVRHAFLTKKVRGLNGFRRCENGMDLYGMCSFTNIAGLLSP